ncbi:MAG TPA: translation initiation factor IF-2 [Candidatus Paceibacterota bacterium]|nr:translation initiation factor IF-2 [Candidatus Paceibacterota bacterium]HPT18182.1 translation initiation factor IF-2 [Candidatus Paceibacterota bacterium]
MEKTITKENIVERPPVIVVMGHIDHGKSTLLDYIRNTNIVDKEAGGITQHISAYEVIHKDEHGKDRKITFLDTPGHAAFSKMRERGAQIADIAILIVSAEDGVKPQTIEAWKTITENNVPYIVAINKIDKPGANIEKTKIELAENEIYLENYGGKIPFAEISAKTGEGVENLLSLLLILAEMESLTAVKEKEASGFVIEANLDSKRGIQATLIIKNGTLKKGMTVAVEDAICSTRIIENFLGKSVDEATFSSPIRLIGFSKIPNIGSEFVAFKNKKDAENYASNLKEKINCEKTINVEDTNKKIIPIVIKTDVSGSLEAIEKEISKIKSENTEFRIVQKGAGSILESDVKAVASCPDAIIVGFNVKIDKSATELAEKKGITVSFFNIIYKMTEWLEEEMEKRRLKVETTEILGKAKILKTFSRTKERQIMGGKVIEGKIALNSTVKIIRRDFEIGNGRIVNLEKNKTKTSSVEEGIEFGMMVESKTEIAPGDIVESFIVTQK